MNCLRKLYFQKLTSKKRFFRSTLAYFGGYKDDHFKLKKRIRRSFLYVPGHDLKKIEKVPQLQADCVVLDCEDGVAFDKKKEARSTITNMYGQISSDSHGEVAVRINPPNSELANDDIASLFGGKISPQTVVLPKINCYKDLSWACDLINDTIERSSLNRNVVDVIVMIESAKGLVNAKETIESGIASCAGSSCRISGLVFGSDDYCADLGISRSPHASELIYARQKLVTTAKAFALDVIDMVYIDYKDSEGLLRQALEGFQMGFTGKQVIHPNQVPIAQNAFSPSSEKIEWALALIQAHQSKKEGVFTFNGQMIDQPTILQAKHIVDMVKFINEKKKL